MGDSRAMERDVFAEFLPGLLGEVAQVAGVRAALALASERGGTRAYIPSVATLHPGHWLAQAVGFEAAVRIAERWGSETVAVPLGPSSGSRASQWRKIRLGLQSGHSLAAIARAAGVTERTVLRHKEKFTRPPDQYSLLD